VKHSERRKKMELLKFVLWLTAGAVIGWFASQIVTTEHRWTYKPTPGEDPSSENI
jgi:hypothetical protein